MRVQPTTDKRLVCRPLPGEPKLTCIADASGDLLKNTRARNTRYEYALPEFTYENLFVSESLLSCSVRPLCRTGLLRSR